MNHECFLNFFTDIYLTQVIESPTHKYENILDILNCINFGLDRIITRLITFQLTNTCDQNFISFKTKIESHS